MEALSVVQIIVISIIPVLFAITVHEVAHGWVANLLGDPTAKLMGRLTLNPIKHIDLVGTIIVPAILLALGGFLFGWAKPVPITWQNLKNPVRDTALVSAAGPLANLVMACIWAVIMQLALKFHPQPTNYAFAVLVMGKIGVFFNIMLMVVNLIPIPPLDGSRIVRSFLPPKTAYQYDRIEPYGFLILLVLLATGLLSVMVSPFIDFFSRLLGQ